MPLMFRYVLLKSSSGTNILNILSGASVVLSFNETLNFVANDDIADIKSEGFISAVRWTTVACFCSKLTEIDTTPFNTPILPKQINHLKLKILKVHKIFYMKVKKLSYFQYFAHNSCKTFHQC